MVVEWKKPLGFFDIWFPLFFLLLVGLLAIAAYNQLWYPLIGIGLTGVIVITLSLIVGYVRPAYAGLVLRLGRRVARERTFYYRLVDGKEEPIKKAEAEAAGFDLNAPDILKRVTKEYLFKKEGLNLVFPILERVVEISLRQHQEKVNEKGKEETDEAYLARAKSFSTGEGVHIFPEILFTWRINNPGKVFELEGGIDKEGNSPFLKTFVEDMVLSGTRGILAQMKLVDILKRMIVVNDQAVEIGEKIKQNVRATVNWEEVGCEIPVIKIADIKFQKDAQDVLEALEAITKERFEKSRKEISAKAELNVRTTLAEAKKREAEADAVYLRRQIAAFVGKTFDQVTQEDAIAYANFIVSQAMAKSLDNNSTIILPSGELGSLVGQFMGLVSGTKKGLKPS